MTETVNYSEPVGSCPQWLTGRYEADCEDDGEGANALSEKTAGNSVHAPTVA